VRQFSVDTHPSQMLVAYTGEPGSPSSERLRFLLLDLPEVSIVSWVRFLPSFESSRPKVSVAIDLFR
jgi:hypothetical protein